MPTFLDRLGGIQEDLSRFSERFVWFYHWAMVNTYFFEGALLVTIAHAWKRKNFSRIDIVTAGMLTYLLFIFALAAALDPALS